MDLSKAKGISVKGNDLFLDALAVFPPPLIRGKLSTVRIAGDQLVQTFGNPAHVALPAMTLDPAATNYMLYRGGTLHFGKLFMTDAEMLIVDADQTTPFDFDNPNYKTQLVAGRSKTLPNLALEVWMPDASSFDRPVAAGRSASQGTVAAGFTTVILSGDGNSLEWCTTLCARRPVVSS